MRIWNDLRPWVSSLTQSAAAKWLPRVSVGELCEIKVRRGRGVDECDRFAVAACTVCHRPTCLHHGHIDQAADIICYVCVGDARDVVPPHQRERARQDGAPRPRPQHERQEEQARQREQQKPPPGKRPPNALEVLTALERLGLKPGATWDQVRVAHRKQSAKLHPDLAKTPKAKAKANTAFVEVQKAFDLLKTVYPEAA